MELLRVILFQERKLPHTRYVSFSERRQRQFRNCSHSVDDIRTTKIPGDDDPALSEDFQEHIIKRTSVDTNPDRVCEKQLETQEKISETSAKLSPKVREANAPAESWYHKRFNHIVEVLC